MAVLGMLVLAGSALAQQTPPVPPGAIPGQAPPPQTAAPQAAPPAAAGQQGANSICLRLQGQLAAFDQGAADPGRADQIKRSEDAIAKQQADLDRAIEQAHKNGCAGTGFFALFSALSPNCGPITSQIQNMRGNLDHMISDLEQLKSGSNDRQDQRRALIGQLAQNNCGAQYTAAANSQGGPQGFFDALFGGGRIVNGNGDGAPSGTFRTVCVRTCDGYYFPISYSTSPARFADDEHACQRLCPASEVALYSYRNPGEDMEQAVSTSGQPYSSLPNAFKYRKEFTPACSCRRQGQSWADALKDADDPTTLQSGDIVVNDQNAKALSSPPKPGGKPAVQIAKPVATSTAATPATTTAAVATDPNNANKKVRTVGPPFMSQSQLPPKPAAPPAQ
ncbi:MAG TPA: DUF2865 domain-containing protein [Xanthobacteraceae bacterium]|nr:DUF2865 domain-containing protein [Xanthobacteraceae bacterium]